MLSMDNISNQFTGGPSVLSPSHSPGRGSSHFPRFSPTAPPQVTLDTHTNGIEEHPGTAGPIFQDTHPHRVLTNELSPPLFVH